MNKQKNQLSNQDLSKLSDKLVLATVLVIVGNKTFSDSQKIKYLSMLFNEK